MPPPAAPLPAPPPADPPSALRDTVFSRVPDANTIVDPASQPPAAAPAPRRIDRYEIRQELGRGGIGVVYKAFHPGLKTHFALKVLLAGDEASKEEVGRFRKEAQALARLRHPGIVAVHDVWEEQGRTYLAMEYIEGVSLDRSRGAALPAAEAVRITREIAEAIQYAHEQGVIHRDLKPANVLRASDGHVKVMDFGLAKMVHTDETQVTRTGALMGTPAYMSPEQVDVGVKNIDAQSDVYQIGAILYELLTGVRAYSGDTEMEILMKVAHHDPPPPRKRNPAIDRDAETICLKAMERERAQRYGTARALAEDCRRFLDGEPVQARRATRLELAVRWARRRKALTSLAAAVALALAVAGAALWHAQATEREKTQLQAEILQGLRTLARVNLDATLMVRRVGGSMREAQEKFLAPLEESARLAEEKSPQLAEPHYHLGRMYRALLRFADARGEQDRALAKEPAYAPSLYERAVLGAQAYGDRLHELRREWLREEGRRLAGGTAKPHARPADDALAETDAEARALRASLVANLTKLEARPAAELPEANRDCARGLFHLYAGKVEDRDRAQAQLERAVAADHYLEEGYEGLARAALAEGRLEDAELAYGHGIDVDKGYLPFRLGRGGVRLQLADFQQRHGQDPSAMAKAAQDDLTQVLAADPANARAWACRGLVRASWTAFTVDRGEDPAARYDEAIADYAKALELEPDSAPYRIACAALRANRGNDVTSAGGDPTSLYEQAAADLAKAIDLSPALAEGWTRRANLFTNWGTFEQMRGIDPSKRYAAALADCDHAIEREPGTPEPWTTRGLVRASWAVWKQAHGEDPLPFADAARADYDQAATLDPESAEPIVWRASLRLNRGFWRLGRGEDPGPEYSAAIADYDRALEICTDSARALMWRGDARAQWALFKQNRGEDPLPLYDQAIADYDRALERNGSSADAWLRRGMLWVNRGNYESARGFDPGPSYERGAADLGKAIALNPKSADAWIRRGDARADAAVAKKAHGGDPVPLYREAFTDYGKGIELNPASADVWAARGLLQAHWGQEVGEHGGEAQPFLDAAEADYAKSLALNSGAAATWMKRAMLHVTQAMFAGKAGGDPAPGYAAAFADFGRAIELNPGDAESRWRRGWLHHIHQHWADSVADFEEARRLQPGSEAIYGKLLADAKRRLGMDPEWLAAVRQGQAAIARRDYPGARAAYERGLAGYADHLAALKPEARAQFQAAASPVLVDAHYNLACALALSAAPDGAFEHLHAAIALGWNDAAHLQEDADLKSLHDDPRWSELLAGINK